MIGRYLAFFATALLLASVPIARPSHAAQPASGLPTMMLTINGNKITAEVASTTEQRATGLMNRFSLQPDHGMLFVFERPEPLGFWMKNTYVALSIAFLDGEGRILNIEDMAPQTETTHWSKGPGKYALEMRKGWFSERGVRPGDRVDGLRKSAPK
jgi:uncharacterized membrane protein (UPF0127 family)